MEKDSVTRQLLEQVNVKLLEIEFWRAEYFKRKLIIDGHYEETKYKYDLVLDSLKFSSNYELHRFYKENELHRKAIVDILQQYFYTCVLLQFKSQSEDIENLKEVLNIFFTNKENCEIFRFFYKISNNYCYYISELLQPTNMLSILNNLDTPLPLAPYYHVNKYGHQGLDPNVLSILYFDHSKKSVINFKIQAETSMWQEVIQEYLDEKKGMQKFSTSEHLWKHYPPDIGTVSVNQISNFADFVITGCTLNPEFDIEDVFNEIKNQVAWILFQQKSKKNIKLTKKETKFILDMAESTITGNYSKNYRETRAIGLYIWDEFQKNPEKSITGIIEALKNEDCMSSYKESDVRTIRRMYQNAERCIREGKIMPVNAK